jgi:hypothetical protein
MNTFELAQQLNSEGFGPSYYSLSRQKPPLEGFVLEKVGDRWIVFFFERGAFREIASFESETDACDYFYEKMHAEFKSVGPKTRN